MKKLFLFVFACLLLLVSKAGAINAPLDAQGHALNTIDWVGASPCFVDPAAGAVAIGCSTGPAIVYGVIASSVPVSAYLVFRDTNTTNVTSSTAAVIYGSAIGTANASGASIGQYIKFPVPLKFNNGISVNTGAALSAPAAWTILYRARNTASE